MFPDLTQAERDVVDATHAGEAVDWRTGDAEADDPRNAASWGDSRTVRAKVLAQLLTAPPAEGATAWPLRLAGARIEGPLDLASVTVRRSVTLTACAFEEQPVFEDAELVALRMPGTYLRAGLDASGCRTRGSIELELGLRADASILLVGAEVGGHVLLRGAEIDGAGHAALSMDGISVGGTAALGGLQATGGVALRGAHVTGQLHFTDARIVAQPDSAAILGDNLVVGLGMFCAGLHAEGGVGLNRAHVRGHLTCDGGRFLNAGGIALNGDALTVDQGMNLSNGFRAEGEIRLLHASIGAQLSLTDAVLAHPDGAALNLEHAHVAGSLFLDPAEPIAGAVVLLGARVDVLEDNANAWRGLYDLRGFEYQWLTAREHDDAPERGLFRDPSVEARLKWLRGQHGGYAPQLYDQLAAMYERLGDDDRRRRVLVAKQRRRRGNLRAFPRLWSLIEDVLVGFGYQTWRALVPFAVLLAAGTIAFAEWQDDGLIEQKATSSSTRAPPFSPLIYTLDLLLPVVNFTQRENWVAAGDAQTWATVYIVCGWILTTAIVAGLTGLVRRNK